jgi:hypothetical protein
MDDELIIDDSVGERCPECGGDVSLTRQRSKGGSSRTVFCIWVIWVFLVLSAVVFSSPWVQAKLGSSLAMNSHSTLDEPRQIIAGEPVLDAGTLLDGDAQGYARVDEWLESLQEQKKSLVESSRVRFVFAEPAGGSRFQRDRGLLGISVSEQASTSLRGFRAERSVDWPIDYPLESVEADYYEWYKQNATSTLLNTERLRLSGGQLYRRWIHLTGISGALSVVILFLIVMTKVFRRCGYDVLRTRRQRLVVYYSCYAIMIGAGLSWATEYGGVSVDGAVSVESEWQADDALDRLLTSEDGRFEALEGLLADLAEGAPADHMLGYEIDQLVESDYQFYGAGLFDMVQLWVVGELSFFEEKPDGSIVDHPRLETTPSGLTARMDWQSGGFMLSYGSQMYAHMFYVFLPNIALVGVVFLGLLRLLFLIGRNVEARGQRRRVARGQCIFCAYPLSKEMLEARTSA